MQWLSDTIAALTGDAASSSGQNTAVSFQSSGTLSEQQLLEFFRAGEQLFKAEDTRRRLKDAKLLKQVERCKTVQLTWRRVRACRLTCTLFLAGRGRSDQSVAKGHI